MVKGLAPPWEDLDWNHRTHVKARYGNLTLEVVGRETTDPRGGLGNDGLCYRERFCSKTKIGE